MGLLSHDMSPRDPLASGFSPSTGPPVRQDHRLKGYTREQMTTHRQPKRENREQEPPKFPRIQPDRTAPPLEQAEVTAPHEFLSAGKRSTEHRRQGAGGLKSRFLNNSVKQLEDRKAETERALLQKHELEVARQREAQRARQAQEKRRDLEQLREYNPWSAPAKPKTRASRKSLQAQQKQAEHSAPEGYHQKAFGKAGGGAARRTSSGKLDTQYYKDEATQLTNVFRGSHGEKVSKLVPKREASDIHEVIKQPHAVTAADQQQQQQQQRASRRPKPTGAPENMFIPGLGESNLSDTRRRRPRTPPNATASGTLISRMGGKGGGAPNEKTNRYARQSPPPKDAYHPFEKAGSGAPLVDHGSGQVNTRTAGAVTRTSNDLTQRKVDLERKQAVAKAQARYLEERAQHAQTTKATKDSGPAMKMDEFFKWKPQQASSVERSFRRQTSDVVSKVVDNGGIGRRQKGPHTKELNATLRQQNAERQAMHSSMKYSEARAESAHVKALGSWQGAAGSGAPRKDPQGNVTTQHQLCREVHHPEFAGGKARDLPKDKKLSYAAALARSSSR